MRIKTEAAILKGIFVVMGTALTIMVVAATQIPQKNSCCCVCAADQDSKPESGR